MNVAKTMSLFLTKTEILPGIIYRVTETGKFIRKNAYRFTKILHLPLSCPLLKMVAM